MKLSLSWQSCLDLYVLGFGCPSFVMMLLMNVSSLFIKGADVLMMLLREAYQIRIRRQSGGITDLASLFQFLDHIQQPQIIFLAIACPETDQVQAEIGRSQQILADISL